MAFSPIRGVLGRQQKGTTNAAAGRRGTSASARLRAQIDLWPLAPTIPIHKITMETIASRLRSRSSYFHKPLQQDFSDHSSQILRVRKLSYDSANQYRIHDTRRVRTSCFALRRGNGLAKQSRAESYLRRKSRQCDCAAVHAPLRYKLRCRVVYTSRRFPPINGELPP